MNIFKFLPLIILIPSLIINFIFIYQSKQHIQSGVPVIGVIDGDTVVLEGKSRVRLRFIDAPEKGLCRYPVF